MRQRGALRADERGAAAVEYSLTLALIFLALIAGVVALGAGIQQTWTGVAEQVTGS